jgi:hypothetical protein
MMGDSLCESYFSGSDSDSDEEMKQASKSAPITDDDGFETVS